MTGPERQLRIDLPQDIQEGPAELILLAHEYTETFPAFDREYDDWLERLIRLYPAETSDEMLSKRIQTERDAWE